QRCLDQPGDFVRYEVATALSTNGKRVIPVLIQHASWPITLPLPASLQRLGECEPIRLPATSDLDRVAAQLQHAALQEEIRHMPRIAFPTLTMLVAILVLLGIPLLLHHTLQWITISSPLDQVVTTLFGYGGALALGLGLWRAVQGRLWGWV